MEGETLAREGGGSDHKRTLGLDSDRKRFLSIVRVAFRNWRDNNATLRAAALAFFMILPLPSLLVIVAAVSSEIYGPVLGPHLLIQQIGAVAGPTVAALVGELLTSTNDSLGSALGAILGVAFAVGGAVGAFAVLQDSLNVVWKVQFQPHRRLGERIRKRGIPFLLVSGIATLVVAFAGLVVLLLNSISGGLMHVFGILASPVILGATLFISFGLAVLLFAITYRELPDTRIAWRDVSLAALVSGFLFTLLNNLFGLYLHAFPVTSIGGAAGSLMLLLLWVYVIDEFVLFGAELSKAYAEALGSRATLVSKEVVMKERERVEKPRLAMTINVALYRLRKETDPSGPRPRRTADEDERA